MCFRPPYKGKKIFYFLKKKKKNKNFFKKI